MIPKNHIQGSPFPTLEAHPRAPNAEIVALLPFFWAGPAPAQATLSIPDRLKEFGSTVEEKVRAAIDHIKKSDLPEKTWLAPFPGRGSAGGELVNRLGKPTKSLWSHGWISGCSDLGDKFPDSPIQPHCRDGAGGGEGSKLGARTDLGP